MLLEKMFFYYIIVVNLLAFVIYGYDKWVAKFSTKRRVSEKELHILAIVGGFLGATVAMIFFRHKISKSSFLWKHAVIVVAWIAALFYIFTQLDPLSFLR